MSTNNEEMTEALSIQNIPQLPPSARFPNAPNAVRAPTRPAKRPPPRQPYYPVPRQINPRPQDVQPRVQQDKERERPEELKEVITQQPQTQSPARCVADSLVESEESMVSKRKEEKQPIIRPKTRTEKKNLQKKKGVKPESERNCCCFCCQTLCYEVCTQFQTQLL